MPAKGVAHAVATISNHDDTLMKFIGQLSIFSSSPSPSLFSFYQSVGGLYVFMQNICMARIIYDFFPPCLVSSNYMK